MFAGNPPGYEVDRFLILKVLGVASGVIWVPLFVYFLSSNRLLMILAIGLAWAACFFGPDLSLDSKIKARRHEISVKLSDTLDLLVISVEAGLGFEQALDRTAATVPGPLSDEIRRVLQETRMGASRADALRALDERTQVEDLATFIVAMLQADTFGVSISRILRAQADEIRLKRRQAAEERVAEGADQDAVPADRVHLPGDLRRRARAGSDPDLQGALTGDHGRNAGGPAAIRR